MTTSTYARLFNTVVESHRHTTGTMCLTVYGVMPDSKRAERLNMALFHTFGRDPHAMGTFLSSFEEYGKEYRQLVIVLWTVSDIIRFKRAIKAVGIDSLDDGDGIAWRRTSEYDYTPSPVTDGDEW